MSNNHIRRNSIFLIIIITILVVCYSYFIRYGTHLDFSFKALLDYASGMPDVAFTLSKVSLQIGGSWGVFDCFRIFINSISGVLEFSIVVIGLIGQAFVVIAYGVGLLFI